MPIRLTCPSCGKGINAPDHFAGRTAKCPGCQGAITIPGGAAAPAPVQSPPPAPLAQPPVAPPLQTTPPPPPPRKASAGKGERGKLSVGWGFLIGCLSAVAVMGVVAIGVVVYIVNQANKVAQQVEQAVAGSPPPAAAPMPQVSEGGETPADPPAEPDPEAVAAQEALAKLRESLGQEIPGFEGMLQEQLEGLQGSGAGQPTPQQLEQAKKVEVVSIKLTPADFKKIKVTNTLELELRNGGDKVLEGFRMVCELKSPDRPIAWGKETVVYKIPGGLLPGETRTLELMMQGELAAIEIPKDAVTTGTVTRADWVEP